MRDDIYQETHIVDPKHIDFQGIMDGLYYPYYMEIVRHRFLKNVVGVDIVEEAKHGNNYVLASIEKMQFKRPIKQDSEMRITCEIYPINARVFGFYQEIHVDNKVVCDAHFTATCAPAGKRAFVPDIIKQAFPESTSSNQ